MHRILLGATLACFILPAAARPSQTEIPFVVSKTLPEVMIGAVVNTGRWEIRSFWLTWRGSNIKKGRCRLVHTKRGAGWFRTDRIRLEQGIPKQSWDKWDIQLRVDQITKESCHGVAIVPSSTPGRWHNFFLQPRGDARGQDSGENTEAKKPDGSTYPRLIRETGPNYTNEAQQAGVTGTSLIQIVVGADGRVDPDKIKVLHYLGFGLEESAIDEILNNWEFQPGTLLNGEPVSVYALVELAFSLREQ